MESIRSLEKTDYNSLFEAFSQAFADYEMQLNRDELQSMLIRRGFVPELSFGAFIDEKLVAFTFNGIGSFNGVKTAYDTGTGTLKEFRGQGFATKIFTFSIPFLKEAGVSHYLLEVLQHNTKAVSVYRKLGFKVSREFYYAVQKQENIIFSIKEMPKDLHIKITDVSLDESLIESMREFWDFNPSWQNSIESISRKPHDFKMAAAYKEKDLLGYCIFEPASGDITQIAVDEKHRRNGIGANLIKAVLKLSQHHSVKAINSEIDCSSITEFLKFIALPPNGKQFEMIKQL